MRTPPRRIGIVGPTASGKSALAHRVALALGDVEIITVDSMQVYRGMDIGTAKPTAEMRGEVRYHLLDVADPAEEFTLRQFQKAALGSIDEIEASGNRPMLVGGTGLYLRAIIDELEIPARYPEVRASLEAVDDVDELYRRLCDLDPVAASRMESTNRRRIVRALEVCLGAGRPFSSYGGGLDIYPPTDWDVVALRVAREALVARIEARFATQIADGFLEEVRLLGASADPPGRTAAQALGYRQLTDHLNGTLTLDEAIEAALGATRRFARRQRSWFGRDPRLVWIDATSDADLDAATEHLVARWRGPIPR